MSAIFVYPLPITAGQSGGTIAGSVAYVCNDNAAMTWRGSSSGSYFVVDLGASPGSYDMVALAGTNLRAGDTVQIRTGNDPSGTGGYAGPATAAWTGTSPGGSTIVVRPIGARTERYVRIDITANGHPDGYAKVARLVVGSAITTIGVDFDARLVYVDRSEVTNGFSYRSVNVGDVVPSWEFSTGWISEDDFRTRWAPLLKRSGVGRSILFIADDSRPDYYQTDAIVGWITSVPAGKSEFYDGWRVDGTILSIAP